jgi:hypothetical protein
MFYRLFVFSGMFSSFHSRNFQINELIRIAGLLLFGIGLQYNTQACAAGIYLCIAFYGTSKIMIYAFLSTLPFPFKKALCLIIPTAEKVFVVWSNGKSRRQTLAYMVSIVAVVFYLVPVLLMIVGE